MDHGLAAACASGSPAGRDRCRRPATAHRDAGRATPRAHASERGAKKTPSNSAAAVRCGGSRRRLGRDARHLLHRLDDRPVAGAAAEIAGQRIVDGLEHRPARRPRQRRRLSSRSPACRSRIAWRRPRPARAAPDAARRPCRAGLRPCGSTGRPSGPASRCRNSSPRAGRRRAPAPRCRRRSRPRRSLPWCPSSPRWSRSQSSSVVIGDRPAISTGRPLSVKRMLSAIANKACRLLRRRQPRDALAVAKTEGSGMDPYRFGYSPITERPKLSLAQGRAGRRLGLPQYRALRVPPGRGAGPQPLAAHAASRRAGLWRPRLRQPGRPVAHVRGARQALASAAPSRCRCR